MHDLVESHVAVATLRQKELELNRAEAAAMKRWRERDEAYENAKAQHARAVQVALDAGDKPPPPPPPPEWTPGDDASYFMSRRDESTRSTSRERQDVLFRLSGEFLAALEARERELLKAVPQLRVADLNAIALELMSLADSVRGLQQAAREGLGNGRANKRHLVEPLLSLRPAERVDVGAVIEAALSGDRTFLDTPKLGPHSLTLRALLV